MKIFLIGFMGSGKSFVGKELASLLKYKFIDTDELIVESKKKSIDKIFAQKGEDYFRKAESKTIRELEGKSKAVIATGGGLPCFHDNMDWMNEHGITIYLKATPALLFHRLFKEKHSRPLVSSLGDIELMEFITTRLSARKAFYEKAHLTIDADKVEAKKLKEEILKLKKD